MPEGKTTQETQKTELMTLKQHQDVLVAGKLLNPMFMEKPIVSAMMIQEVDTDFGFLMNVPEIKRSKDFLNQVIGIIRISEEMETGNEEMEDDTYINIGFLTLEMEYHETSLYGNAKENLMTQYLIGDSRKTSVMGFLNVPMKVRIVQGTNTKTGHTYYGIQTVAADFN